jgi:hypothetical protein
MAETAQAEASHRRNRARVEQTEQQKIETAKATMTLDEFTLNIKRSAALFSEKAISQQEFDQRLAWPANRPGSPWRSWPWRRGLSSTLLSWSFIPATERSRISSPARL